MNTEKKKEHKHFWKYRVLFRIRFSLRVYCYCGVFFFPSSKTISNAKLNKELSNNVKKKLWNRRINNKRWNRSSLFISRWTCRNKAKNESNRTRNRNKNKIIVSCVLNCHPILVCVPIFFLYAAFPTSFHSCSSTHLNQMILVTWYSFVFCLLFLFFFSCVCLLSEFYFCFVIVMCCARHCRFCWCFNSRSFQSQ